MLEKKIRRYKAMELHREEPCVKGPVHPQMGLSELRHSQHRQGCQRSKEHQTGRPQTAHSLRRMIHT